MKVTTSSHYTHFWYMLRRLPEVIANVAVLILCAAICAAGFVLGRRDRHAAALGLILAAGMALRIHAASDRFLHTWDERYHAVVAAHLVLHPLTPTLFERPALPYDFRNWTANHIWLEKGPVPLWAIAAAIRLFGTDERVVRVPSVLASLSAVCLTYAIASILFDRRTALLAAFFHAINGLVVELAAGRVSSDHVDTLFICLIELGVFLSVLYITGRRRWYVPLLIGAATGTAVLCKWFPALVVFPVWISAALLRKDAPASRLLRDAAIAGAGCAVVVWPYAAYIGVAFPREAAWVFRKYLVAYTDTIDAHSGPFYFYLQKIGVVFGELIYLPLLLGLYETFTGRPGWRIGMLNVWWLLPTLVFSFAETKRPTYLLISAPAFFILLSHYWYRIASVPGGPWRRRAAAVALFLLIALPVRYTIDRITPFESRGATPPWSPCVKSLKDTLKALPGSPRDIVVFNVGHNIEAMFYSGMTIYNFMPNEPIVDDLIARGWRVVVNDDGRAGIRFSVTDQVTVLKLAPPGEY